MTGRELYEAIGLVDERYLDMVDTPETENNTIMEKQTKPIHFRKITSFILAACLIFTLGVTVYATDIGGIRRMIQIWLFGDRTTAVLDMQDGQYTLTDEEGSFIRGGGGVAIEPDGSERPLTEAEILEHLDHPEVAYLDDGSIWVFYRGQKIEITDRFDKDGFCYLTLQDGEDVLYATIDKNGGMATSPVEFVQPHAFGTSEP